MYNYINYLLPDEHQGWKSAYEIELAARKHESQRVRMLNEETAWGLPPVQTGGSRKAGLLSFLKAPMHMLAALIG